MIGSKGTRDEGVEDFLPGSREIDKLSLVPSMLVLEGGLGSKVLVW